MSGDSGEISGNSELSAISTPKLSQVFVWVQRCLS
jgi:hypothetical protein